MGQWLTSIGSYTCTTSTYTFDNIPNYPGTDTVALGILAETFDENNYKDTFFDISEYLQLELAGGAWNSFKIYLKDIPNNTYIVNVGGGGNRLANSTIMFWMDYENEEARAVGLTRYSNYPNEWQSSKWNGDTASRKRLFQLIMQSIPPAAITSNGGGATHIAKVTGQLKDLSSNLSDILIVSGGGGGGLLMGETEYAGADAGGISGSGDNSADQSTGYAFGQGESSSDVSGGGGGLYGGYKGVVE